MTYPTSRQHGKGKSGQSKTHTTLDQDKYRRIVIVRGIQFTDRDFDRWIDTCKERLSKAQKQYDDLKHSGDREKVKQAMKKVKKLSLEYKRAQVFPVPDRNGKIMNRLKLEKRGSGREFPYKFYSDAQKITYLIRVAEEKHELKTWLAKPDVHVIYGGHARYGRGPCFGYPCKQGDRWEDGTGCRSGKISPNDGMFRMGHDIVGVPLKDLYNHRYTTRPLQGAFKVNKKTCHRDIVNAKPPAQRIVVDPEMNVAGIQGNKPNAAKENWGYWIRDKTENCIRIRPLFNLWQFFYKWESMPPEMLKTPSPIKYPYGEFWGFTKLKKKTEEYRLHILLHAGWKDTTADPWEIGDEDLTLRCQVFCLFACSTYKHFRRILRGKGYVRWRKRGKGRKQTGFAYFTSATSYSATAAVWLFHLLQFPHRSKGRSWGPSLEYARKNANKTLRDELHYNYKIL